MQILQASHFIYDIFRGTLLLPNEMRAHVNAPSSLKKKRLHMHTPSTFTRFAFETSVQPVVRMQKISLRTLRKSRGGAYKLAYAACLRTLPNPIPFLILDMLLIRPGCYTSSGKGNLMVFLDSRRRLRVPIIASSAGANILGKAHCSPNGGGKNGGNERTPQKKTKPVYQSGFVIVQKMREVLRTRESGRLLYLQEIDGTNWQ
ncbi:hypothetical protein HYFRA_00009496 [Hymenoscyphus fraxineus]|uniref:Uncharacterized protein n=1 Tax=Hymenoscyphus fraxineus TaxID=746836 RepID=A0A9N9L1W4_9HELO|nr:hypothetical protein HYFRA_00009496 [Hymenoscyphus fraxineus]